MALIRPLKTNGKDLVDIRETEGAVTSNIINSSTNSAINPRYLGAPQDDGVKRAKSDREDESIYTKTSFINLPLPVLNYFTAGNSFSAFSKILSEAYGDEVKVEDIVSGKVIFNKKTGESMSSIGSSDVFTDMVYTPDILIGAQYLEYLLNQIDIDEVIIKTLVTFSRGVLKKIGVDVKEVNVTVSRGAGEYQILDDYYMDTNAEFNVEAFGCKLDEELQALLNDYENPLLYMFSVRDRGMCVLTDQIQYKIFVLPYGFRPNFKKRKDPLTKAYQSLFRVSVDLENRMRQYGTKVSDIRMGYIELVKAVKYVTVDSSQGYVSEYKSIAESIIGKHGLIRDRMMGVRVDYSGRSVITVDPTMSVDTIGIPEDMAPKLMELTCLGEMETESFNKDGLLRRKAAFKQKAIEILNRSFIVPGRQPTLYKHGLQAFRVKVVKGNAIVLNPLTCPSFNADFDGDQMHVITPIGEGAVKDVEHLMLNTKNLFYSKSGECHIAPRQEIIYGLWLSSVVTPDGHRDKSKCVLDSETLLDDICEERVNIYDTVVFNGKTMTVGEYGIRKCFPEAIRTVDIGNSPITVTGKMNCKAVTEKWFKELLKYVFLNYGEKPFIDTTNALVKLGFAIAEFFPPAIPVVNFPDVSGCVEEFDNSIKEREELYSRGFDTDLSFDTFYNEKYEELTKKVDDILKKEIPEDSGYKQMMLSGARGSMKNLRQLFGLKGRIQKNSAEIFNTIIKNPTANQLTGLEHFVSAYGARHDLKDKSISTYKPGYLSRRMGHAASAVSIVSKDCGDTEGLRLDFDFIKQFIGVANATKPDIEVVEQVEDFLVKMLLGRYVIEDGVTSDIILTEEQARTIISMDFVSIGMNGDVIKHSGVRLRSPLTCKDPCCVKCFGRNEGTQTLAVVGLPVGSDAATSIGEPGTQMTMKNFQGGGVAGQKNLTSSFDLMDKLLEMQDLFKNSDIVTYDYLAPVEGEVKTVSVGDGTKKLCILDPKTKKNLMKQKVYFYEHTKLKNYVTKGEPICVEQGHYNIHEVIKYRGMPYAIKYLTVQLYSIFVSQNVDVNFKHFEVLISSMVFHVCTVGNEHFKSCHYYTNREYYNADRDGAEFFETIKGLKDTPRFREDVFSTMFLEDIKKGIHRSIVISGKDDLKYPIIRYAFGLSLGMGSDIPTYWEERSKYGL